MSPENLQANIDVVNFPADKKVFLARTSSVIGVGVIGTRSREVYTVAINKGYTTAEVAHFRDLTNALTVLTSTDKTDAIVLAISIIQEWFNENSFEPRQLTVDDFTEVLKDARPNQPHMMHLGGGLMEKMELMHSEWKLGQIQKNGVLVPIKPLIKR